MENVTIKLAVPWYHFPSIDNVTPLSTVCVKRIILIRNLWAYSLLFKVKHLDPFPMFMGNLWIDDNFITSLILSTLDSLFV